MNNAPLLRNETFMQSVVDGLRSKPTKVKAFRIFKESVFERPKIGEAEIQLTNYFGRFKSRNMYYVQMKSIVAKKLRKRGFTLQEIASVVNLKHHVVMHYCNHQKSNPEVHKFVSNNYKSWIQNGQYPTSARSTKNNLISCELIVV